MEKFKLVEKKIEAWRQPTPSEIRFGEGAIHWGEFTREEFQKPDGTLKKWIKAEGLRYNR